MGHTGEFDSVKKVHTGCMTEKKLTLKMLSGRTGLRAGNFHSYNNGDEPTASTCTCTQASKQNFVATFAGKMVSRYKLLVDSLRVCP